MTRGFGGDLRIAARRLLATPLFASFAVASLAVGIGVTTVAYSVVDAFFFTRLTLREPDRLAIVSRPGTATTSVSRPDFDDLRAAQRSFDTIAASRSLNLPVTSPATTELVRAEAVSGAYFQTLNVGAQLGRPLRPADDDTPAPVAVLSHALWRKRFAADPRVVGRTVRIGGRALEIVGVAPEGFTGAITTFGPFGTQLWVPLGAAAWFDPAVRWFARPGASPTPERERRQLLVVGRLRPGVSVERAAAELGTVAAGLDASYPATLRHRDGTLPWPRGWTARTIARLHAETTEGLRRLGVVVAGLVFLVLVVACTNLANLVLARGTARHQEFAVRRALGAERWRLVRAQIAESLLIALAGALAAYLVMRGLAAVLAVDVPLAQRWIVSLQPAIDLRTLAVAATALLVSLVVFGLEPAIQLTRIKDVHRALMETAGGVGAPKAGRQRMLLRWQVAISTGFFILASMSVRYVLVEAGHDSGVDVDRLGIAVLNFVTQGWDEARARRALDRVIEEAGRERRVESVAVSTGLPFGTTSPPFIALSTPDRPIVPAGKYADASLLAATPGIFRTLGVPILRGRSFDDRDDAGAPPIVVASETAARELFGTSDAVGRQILMQVRLRGPDQPVATATIVGIARDTDTSYMRTPRDAVIYAPLTQHFDPLITVVARGAGGRAAAAAGAVQAAIRRADPDLATAAAGTGPNLLTGAYAFLRLAGTASLSLGLLTLVLAMVGLYGVQSHGVARRTREIGVRMSFGASAAQIKRMILRDGYRPVVEGMAIGIFIGLTGRGLVRAYLDVRISILDPWMLGVVPIPLVLAAFWACYLPARRASRVDPNVALRHL